MWRALAIVGLAGIAMVTDLATRGDDAPWLDPIVEMPKRTVTLAPPAPATTAPIAGWVIDGNASPIEGVVVSIAGVEVARSEADGAFRVDKLVAGDVIHLDAAHVFPAEVTWIDGPPPRILLARRITVEAHVTAGGAAASGATVYLSDGSGPAVATAVTDERGAAAFADRMPGPYELWAVRGATATPLVRETFDGDGDHAVDLVLAAAGKVLGVVHAADGVPLGARVQLVPVDFEHAARVAAVDATGAFAVEGVPPGPWRVVADAPSYLANTTNVVDVAADGPPAEVVVELRRAGSIAGTVVDETGAPVAGATIVLSLHGATAAPRATQAPAPSQALRWVHPLAGERQMPIRETRVFGAPRAAPKPAECGKGHCGVDLGTKKGEMVHAAADGTLVAVFTEIRPSAGRYVAILHAGGLYTFYMHLDQVRPDLEVGQRIRAGDPVGTVGTTGFSRPNPHLHFALAQDRAGRLFYIDPAPMLQHAVVLPVPREFPTGAIGAAPTVIAAVRWGEVEKQGGAASVPGTTAATGGAATTAPVSDAYGAFRIDGVAPGSYTATAFATELAPGTSAPFVVKTATETAGVVIRLAPGVVVVGRVMGRDGPVRGARIVADEGAGETAHQVASVYADRYGEYKLRALSGKVTLSVSAPGYGTAERAIDLAPARSRGAERREDFDLVIEDRTLRGRVVGPDGVPVIGVQVVTVDGPSRRRSAVTGPGGDFLIERVATGSYIVQLTSADHPVSRGTIKSEEWTELALERGGALHVEVRDAHTGAGLGDVRIDADGPRDRSAQATTGADGVADLRALAPGAWTLRVRVPGYVAVERALDVDAADRPADVRIELARGATLAGVVRDRYGQRVAGARVWLGSAATRTDRDGNFRLVDVPTGAGQLRAEKELLHGAIAVDLRPGDEQITLSIDLAE
jgi:murein DD-endopeptidase MepM/ murein hydrolase activator NlpD